MLVINLLGLLRPDFAVAVCFPSLALLVAVVLLAVLEHVGDLSLEPLDSTPAQFAGGFS